MIWNWLVGYLIRRAKRTPYWHLPGYMERYWLVPYAYERPLSPWRRPLGWLLQRFGIAVRVHKILRADLDRHYHDHPWDFVSVVLRGWYVEARPVFESGMFAGKRSAFRPSGSVAFRRATTWHRIAAVPHDGVWTLFITGPYRQRWGFLVEPQHKVYYKDYDPAATYSLPEKAEGGAGGPI